MGWASAGDIFDPIAQALIDCGADEATKRRVLGDLIDRLQGEDWDTEDESLDAFRHDLVVVSLFYQRTCGPRFFGAEAGVVVEGVVGFDEQRREWTLACDRCGELERAPFTVAGHDGLVRAWSAHDRDVHGGDGGVRDWALLSPETPDDAKSPIADQPAPTEGRGPSTHDLDDEAVHGWFGLSYSNYAVQHRTLLQSMPAEWQRRWVACMEELSAAFSHVETADCYIVTAACECTYSDLSERDMKELGITVPDAADGDNDDADLSDVFYDRDGGEHAAWDLVLAPRPGGDPVPHYRRGRTRIEPRLAAREECSAPVSH